MQEEYEDIPEYEEAGAPQTSPSIIKLILSPDFPKHHQEIFEYLRPFVDKTAALGNFDPIEMEILRLDLELAKMYLKVGCVDLAREKMVDFVNRVQLSRGKEGFWTRMQSIQIQKVEQKILQNQAEARRRTLFGKLFARQPRRGEEAAE